MQMGIYCRVAALCLLLIAFADKVHSNSANHEHISPSSAQLDSSRMTRMLKQRSGSSMRMLQQSSGSSCALVKAIQAQQQLKVLSWLINSCGLAATVCESTKQGTLLAPTDDAFNEYLTRRKLSLVVLASQATAVRSLLLYHIIPDPKDKQLLSAGSTAAAAVQGVSLHTAATSAPSEVIVRHAGGTILLTDARGNTAKVLQPAIPAGGPALLLLDRILSHTAASQTLGGPGPGLNGMAGVRRVEENGSPRLNGKASIAHASGAVGSERDEDVLLLQRQP